jgi:aspartyl-tRNA(Asn)/glutamyl-tRNA(Gln) amidotransferase subunit B
MAYEPVIGLEVHLQLSTQTKLFCGCLTKFGAAPNSQTCPVCLWLPGTLPVLNERALEWGMKVGLALECTIAPVMKFDRKQYFYPDLPKGYQISQFDKPLAQRGGLAISAGGQPRRIGIHRAHLEEDAGKLLHDQHQTASLVDYNRTGVPLIEIVSDPDLRSPEEAYEYLVHLKAVLEYLDVSTCNMEEGSLRCDANVSLRPVGQHAFGAKVEVKNLNSFKAVKQALEFEIKRQTLALQQGSRIVQETRLWDAKALQTTPMRSKEEAADYRYFPEPDLVPFVIDRARVDAVRAQLPESPHQRAERFQRGYQLSAYDAGVLTQSRALAELFEGALKAGASPKPVANWLMGDFAAYLNAKGQAPETVKLDPRWLVHLLELIAQGTLSGKMAKDVFVQMLEQGQDPAILVREQGLQQIVDTGLLARVAAEIVQAHPQSAEDYRKGKASALTFLMGQAMKQTKGKANPQQMSEALKRQLQEGS